jgi:hypothetical protein
MDISTLLSRLFSFPFPIFSSFSSTVHHATD